MYHTVGAIALFVAVSTRCFPDIPFVKALQRLADLDFTCSEIAIGDGANDLHPEWIAQDLTRASRMCLTSRQISPISLFLDYAPQSPQYASKFVAALQLCQALRIGVVVVKSSVQGSPYNEEYERFRQMAQLANRVGVSVAALTEANTIAGTIDSIQSLCGSLHGLTVALDPSHFIYGHKPPVDYESIIPYVSHVHLRDTTSKKFQVQIGQGELEYNRLVAQLNRQGYSRALCIDLAPLPNIDQDSELRKMRLLVESIL
ncbi:MAG: TIM barrel protein [Planctomycetia bacterium]|nr:TIM barrel protein [Planctomycetia bacterium]